MKALLPLLVLATSLILTSCNDSGSKSSAASTNKGSGSDASSFTSNLSAEENAALDKQMQTMFKHALITNENVSKNGCKISFTDQVSNLRDDANESIIYQKSISQSATKQCGDITISQERMVVVAPGDTCERTYQKNGNTVTLNACGSISTINLSTKTATSSHSDEESTTTATIRAISLNKAELTQELQNVTIVYKKADANGEEIEDSREIGNALQLLNITL